MNFPFKLCIRIFQSFIIAGFVFPHPVFGSHEESVCTEHIDTVSFITTQGGEDNFVLSSSGKSAPLIISSEDYPGVLRALRDLQMDIGKVTGVPPHFFIDTLPGESQVLFAGTIGKSPLIGELVKSNKIYAGDISGKWECFMIQVVQNPFPGQSQRPRQ